MTTYSLGHYGLVDPTTHLFPSYFSSERAIGGAYDLYSLYDDADHSSIHYYYHYSTGGDTATYAVLNASQQVVVSPYSPGPYSLKVSADSYGSHSWFGFVVSPKSSEYVDAAGETKSNALNLGTVTSTISHSDSFFTLFDRTLTSTSLDPNFSSPLQADQHDFYKFHIDSEGDVAINYSGSHGAFILYGGPQGNIDSSFQQIITSGQSTHLIAGDYTVEVVDSQTQVAVGAQVIEFRNARYENYEDYSFSINFTASGGTTDSSLPDRGNGNLATFNGHSYQYVSFYGQTESWYQARDTAAAMGGYLATITSQAESDFISNHVIAGHLTNGLNAAFIGSSDAANEGVWKWVTGPEAGTTFWNGGASGTTASGGYAHWGSGEPSNATSNPEGSENYGAIEGNGTWNDVPSVRDGSITTGFIVEFATTSGATNIRTERFFDSATGDHFYTMSPAEAAQIRATLPTYHDEGAPWGTPAKGANTVDVFRFFDVATNTHFLTSSTAERDQVLATLPSYHYEGVAFEAYTTPGTGTLTLERFFNTISHLHTYSASAAETTSILHGGAGPGWVDEGAGFIVHI